VLSKPETSSREVFFKTVRGRPLAPLIKPKMKLVIEHWRAGKLLSKEEKESDLVVDIGLNYLCDREADTPPPAMRWTEIGENPTAVSSNQTYATMSGVMRTANTYSKDPPVGEASLDASFTIDGTYSLNECCLINVSGLGQSGIMYCRDTYATKSVVSGDTVNVNYTITFAAV